VHGYQPAMIAMAALATLSAVIAALFVRDQPASAPVASPVSEPATT